MAINGMDEASIKTVNDCSNSYDGMNILNELGTETKALDPTLNFVPWVTFNGVFIIDRSLSFYNVEIHKVLLCGLNIDINIIQSTFRNGGKNGKMRHLKIWRKCYAQTSSHQNRNVKTLNPREKMHTTFELL